MPDRDPFTLTDVEAAIAVISESRGMQPNLLMIGDGPARELGVEPGVYRRNAAGVVEYFTFDEWDAQ